jgi:hypothetical protein
MSAPAAGRQLLRVEFSPNVEQLQGNTSASAGYCLGLWAPHEITLNKYKARYAPCFHFIPVALATQNIEILAFAGRSD